MEGAGATEPPKIVQPSLLDTVRTMLSILQAYISNSPYRIRRNLNDEMKRLEEKCGGKENQLTKHEVNSTFVNCCQMTEKSIEERTVMLTEEERPKRNPQLPMLKAQFETIFREEPKEIATYTAGYKGHVKLNGEDYFVDVGIAELEDDQATELKEKMKEGGKEDETCRVKEVKNLTIGTHLTKRGRTTSTTRGVLESKVILKEPLTEKLLEGGCEEWLFHVHLPDCHKEKVEQRGEMVSHQYCFSPFKYNFLFQCKNVHQF